MHLGHNSYEPRHGPATGLAFLGILLGIACAAALWSFQLVRGIKEFPPLED